MNKAKLIPALVMLLAGFVLCVVCIANGYSLGFMLRALLLVLILFYLLGFIIRIVVEINFSPKKEEMSAEDMGFLDGEVIEDIDPDDLNAGENQNG